MKKIIQGLIPLILLAIVVVVFLGLWSPVPVSTSSAPIEEIVVERTRLEPNLFVVDLRNDGPDPVQIAQVLVNGAYWAFEIDAEGPIGRLAKARISIEYPWLEGDDQHLTLVTSTGATFAIAIPAAARSLGRDGLGLGTLALIGALIGIVPVFLGLLWFPFIRGLKSGWYGFILALTVGLLVFLGVDAIEEALETVHAAPASLNGVGVLVIGFFLSFVGLYYLSRGRKRDSATESSDKANTVLAFGIALGIGIHNLGEGLAVGSAYALGNISLGTTLVVGFIIHNITEGIPIIAPLAGSKARVGLLAGLGLVAGAPAILGAWIGGFAYSAIWAVFFLGIGAGAIFQVAIEILSRMAKGAEARLFSLQNSIGFLTGLLVMYGTGLLIAA